MREIVRGVHHWTRKHPNIGIEVSSYLLSDERVVLDPLVPEGGLDALPVAPEHVVMTNRHHDREAAEFVGRFGCRVWCPAPGMHEIEGRLDATPYDMDTALPGGISGIEIGAICPDEFALLVPREGGILAIADGAIRSGDGPLGFVPDAMLGDDPDAVKNGLRAAFAQVCVDCAFEHVLLAHGHPIVGGGKVAVQALAAG